MEEGQRRHLNVHLPNEKQIMGIRGDGEREEEEEDVDDSWQVKNDSNEEKIDLARRKHSFSLIHYGNLITNPSGGKYMPWITLNHRFYSQPFIPKINCFLRINGETWQGWRGFPFWKRSVMISVVGGWWARGGKSRIFRNKISFRGKKVTNLKKASLCKVVISRAKPLSLGRPYDL